MARLSLRHAWLQKHPTPGAAAGEFHWYPEIDPASNGNDGAIRRQVVEQVQGIAPPAVWWQLTPGRVLWAAVWAAVSPSDARPYRGVSLSIIEGQAGAEDLLAHLRAANPAPYSGPCASKEGSAAAPSPQPGKVTGCDGIEVARAMIDGGVVTVADPYQPAIPSMMGELARLLPAHIAHRTRTGQWRSSPAVDPTRRGRSQERSQERERVPDRVAWLLAAAWRSEDGVAGRRARQAWSLLGELARHHGVEMDEIAMRSEQVARSADAFAAMRPLCSAEEHTAWQRRHGSSATSWPRLLHVWGRGWFDRSSHAGALLPWFADQLALRALAVLANGGDALEVLAHARWHALLPAPRRTALLTEIAAFAPSLATELFGARPFDQERCDVA